MSELIKSAYDKKLISWASGGLLVFLSAFLWAPSRDGIQLVFFFSFFIPIFLYFVKYPKKIWQNRINLAALAYAAYAAAASFWGNPSDAGHFFFNFLVLLVWLSGVSLLYSFKFQINAKHLTWFCILGAFFSIGSMIYYYTFVHYITVYDNRVWGWNVFRNSNEFGAACGVISLICFTLSLESKKILNTYLLLFVSILCFLGLLASFSRGAFLAYFVTAVFVFVAMRPSLKTWGPPISLLLALGIGLFISFDLHIYFLERKGEFLGGRIEMWKYFFDHIQDYFWFGQGMSKDTTIFVPQLNLSFNHFHNAWLDTFYRTGLLGVLLILWHVVEVSRHFSRSPNVFPFFVWWIYGATTMIFDGRVIFWEMGAKWFFYWIPVAFIAAIVASENYKNHQRQAGLAK